MIQNNKIKFKIGDKIIIIAGKYKKQNGKIIKIIKKKNSVIIENINLKIKHNKPKKTEDKGEITKVESYIHISNIKNLSF
uniref:Large ribosomal subunit protein uL24c n=1 Tax=Caloglossa beccarii TaxID=131038 RepID=A0A1Z1M8P0_9FLOR|nr:ribosomal protein L24 [Caloglossa beccarii]ARW62330.1 ribosomal protein L24 [Caloglossa beccarii]